MLVVGSMALARNGMLQSGRTPKDIDFIMTEEEYDAYTPPGRILQTGPTKRGFFLKTDSEIYDIEIAHPFSSGLALLEYDGGVCGGAFLEQFTASPATLLALKMSHRYLKDSPFFRKTRADILWLRDSLGVVLDQFHLDWLPHRERETYTYAHPKLNQTKDDFFKDDGITYKYDHDTLHLAVKLTDVPMYTRYAETGEQVKSSKALWAALTLHEKRFAVWEESAVLALERSMIPFGTDEEKAFRMALMKVCTSITSGWFREFAWENYDEVLNIHRAMARMMTIKRRFELALDAGIVQPFKGSTYGSNINPVPTA